jgi:hypothetical protein
MMATYLRRAKIAPDLVICSTAMRQLADSDSVNLGSNPGPPARRRRRAVLLVAAHHQPHVVGQPAWRERAVGFNGRTADSDSVNPGSNPGPPAMHLPDMTPHFQFPHSPLFNR